MSISSGIRLRTFALYTVIPLRRAGQMASHGADTDDDHAVRKFRGGWNESVSLAESLNCRGLSMWLSQGWRLLFASRTWESVPAETCSPFPPRFHVSLSHSVADYVVWQWETRGSDGTRMVDGYFQCCCMGGVCGLLVV